MDHATARPPCFECGNPSHEDHHVVPRVRGGTRTVPLCSPCHGKAHGIGRNGGHGELVRTALKAAKRRGVVLGNPNGAEALRRAGKGNKAAVNALRANADAHAEALRPVLADLHREGITSLERIAAALNERGMQTPRGGLWYATSVRNLKARLSPRLGDE